jgi:hypothetical protein
MKLYLSLLVTASGLAATAGATFDDLNNNDDETSRTLMEDPLNNLRGNFGGWRPRPPAPRPSPQTRIPSPWVSTGIPTPFPVQAPWVSTGIPTPFPAGIPTPRPNRYTGVPTPFPSPGTPSPSDVPSVSLSPSESLSPTVECGPPIDNYTKMGKGRCLDSSGEQYPLVRFDGLASPADCEVKCGCVANILTLQGFDFNYGTTPSICRCLVNENTPDQLKICGYDGFNANRIGFGQITSIQPNNNVCCFRDDLASPAPSVSPAPSTSLVPSESLSPSQSLSPTQECGPPIDDYTKMGKGRCLDSNGDVYPLVRYDGVDSPADCAEKCNCLFNRGFILQGFDYNVNVDRCFCRVDDTSRAVGACGGSKNAGNPGSGPIISTDGVARFCCFRNDLTSPAPSVSNAPSTSLAPSVSLAPTKQWKNSKLCNGDDMCRSKCCRPAPEGHKHYGQNVCVNSRVDERCRTEVPSSSPTT